MALPLSGLVDAQSPDRLAASLGLRSEPDLKALATAVREAEEADHGPYLDALAAHLVEVVPPEEIRAQLDWYSNPAGEAEHTRLPKAEEQVARLAQSVWPAFQRRIDRLACASLKCPPAPPGSPAPPPPPLSPAPPEAAVVAAKAFLKREGIFQTNRELVQSEVGPIVLETGRLAAANPTVPRDEVDRVVRDAAYRAADEMGPEFLERSAQIYATTFSIDELAAIGAFHQQHDNAERGARLAGLMMRDVIAERRQLLQDIKARYCGLADCPVR